jgi:hypothetical protein
LIGLLTTLTGLLTLLAGLLTRGLAGLNVEKDQHEKLWQTLTSEWVAEKIASGRAGDGSHRRHP